MSDLETLLDELIDAAVMTDVDRVEAKRNEILALPACCTYRSPPHIGEGRCRLPDDHDGPHQIE